LQVLRRERQRAALTLKVLENDRGTATYKAIGSLHFYKQHHFFFFSGKIFVLAPADSIRNELSKHSVQLDEEISGLAVFSCFSPLSFFFFQETTKVPRDHPAGNRKGASVFDGKKAAKVRFRMTVGNKILLF